ncbi:MAG: LysM peptidoglycan-binding domain-containing protein, partial [Oscillospiraceae bacterium]|nr:LysM peptidoglycan-binding domain-containing protein [Oscillospiraceae bacterium]
MLVCCAGRVPGPAVAADADAAVTYKVAVGDSIWLIARKFATTMAELRRLNNLTTNLIFPGATLVVSRPASGDAHLYVTYTILRGDTLGKIAE